jgi:hypothetical protein
MENHGTGGGGDFAIVPADQEKNICIVGSDDSSIVTFPVVASVAADYRKLRNSREWLSCKFSGQCSTQCPIPTAQIPAIFPEYHHRQLHNSTPNLRVSLTPLNGYLWAQMAIHLFNA